MITGKSEITDSRAFIGRWVRRIFIFHVVCLTWVFFRAPSVHDAFTTLSGLGVWEWQPVYGVALTFLAAYAALIFMLDLQLESSGGEYLFENRAFTTRVAAGLATCMLITIFGANQANAFIYFQF